MNIDPRNCVPGKLYRVVGYPHDTTFAAALLFSVEDNSILNKVSPGEIVMFIKFKPTKIISSVVLYKGIIGYVVPDTVFETVNYGR
jgi:hypothetical protein